jgi:hypothetical protein
LKIWFFLVRVLIMKNIITLFMLGLSVLSAQPVFKSYADVFPAVESRLSMLNDQRRIEDTAVGSVPSGSGSFATSIDFPSGTTQAVLSTATFTVTRRINGVTTVVASNINISASQFNPEGDVSLPSIFYRNSANGLVVPAGFTLVGTTLTNPKTLLLTEQKITLPQLVVEGDFWEVSRSFSGNYTLGGTVFPFSTTTMAKVIVVNQTVAPINSVTTEYPQNPQTVFTQQGGTGTITATGLTVDSYNKTWWIESSTNLVDWSVVTNATVAPSVTITFPIIPGEPKMFWRIKWFIP